MALNVRNVSKFANSTCVLLSRSTFIDKENTFMPFWVPHFKQYSACSGTCKNALNNIKNHQIDYRKYQCSLNLEDLESRDQIYRFNNSEQLNNLKTDQVDNERLFSEKEDLPNKPSAEQLTHVYNVLADNLPKFFIQPLDYKIYHNNIIFEDHIRNIRTVGIYSYIKQVNLLRTVGHLKFAYVTFEILKITQHPEDSTIKIRWRIKGISALKVMVTFWKYKLWNFKEIFEKTGSWHDGFSTFYVDGDGKVVKHVADKMMPDSDEVIASKNITGAIKLALIVGVIPRFSEFNYFL